MTIHITKYTELGVLRKATNQEKPFVMAQVTHVNDAETIEYTLAGEPVYLGDDTTLIVVENDAAEAFYFAVSLDDDVDLDTHFNIRNPATTYEVYGVLPGSYFVAEATKGTGPT